MQGTHTYSNLQFNTSSLCLSTNRLWAPVPLIITEKLKHCNIKLSIDKKWHTLLKWLLKMMTCYSATMNKSWGEMSHLRHTLIQSCECMLNKGNPLQDSRIGQHMTTALRKYKIRLTNLLHWLKLRLTPVSLR